MKPAETVKIEVPKKVLMYDKVTQLIWKLLVQLQMPALAEFYIKSPMLYNFMLVGTSGTILSWILYEVMFRPFTIGIPVLGTFIGMAITTLCVFFWNFIWNKKWSLNIRSQLLKMNSKELDKVKTTIEEIQYLKDTEGAV